MGEDGATFLHDRHGALADQRDGHRMGAHAVARDAAGGVESTSARTRRDRSMTDLERLGLAIIGFAVAIIVGGVLLGLIGAAIKRGRG